MELIALVLALFWLGLLGRVVAYAARQRKRSLAHAAEMEAYRRTVVVLSDPGFREAAEENPDDWPSYTLEELRERLGLDR